MNNSLLKQLLIEYDIKRNKAIEEAENKKEQLLNVNPKIAEIDKEAFDLIACPLAEIGISITVSHYNPYRDNDVNITYDSGRKRKLDVPSLSEMSNSLK